jgi:replication initiation and membrane attachment protein DnaB
VNELKDTPFKKSKTVVQGKPKQKTIRKEMLPSWLNEDGEVIEQDKPQRSIEEIEAFELEKQKLFDRIKNYKAQTSQEATQGLETVF